jgi:RES domain
LCQSQLEALVVEFFWNGSFFRTEFGGAHRLASNPYRYGEREVEFPSWLETDAHLLEDVLKVGIFHYGPPLWRVGMVEPLTALTRSRTRRLAAQAVVESFPERILSSGTRFYRIRKNLDGSQERDYGQYDAPPKNRASLGRLDSKSLSVLYGSEDLEICVHECRILIPDECYVATLRPTRNLRMLDLTEALHEDGPTPFESLEIAMRYLFAAESHSYGITRAIARAAKTAGFDGIFFPSYFSLVKTECIANIALFGHPIRDGAVHVECINRAMLKSAIYELRMGPIFS